MLLPAATARALLAGFGAVGLDSRAVREAAGIDEASLLPVDGVLPGEAFERLWTAAFQAAPREELPTEVGLAVPFGAFGTIDYLAASSETVEAAFHALASHFRQVAAFSLEIVGVQTRRRPVPGTERDQAVPGTQGADDVGEVRLVPPAHAAGTVDRARAVSDEFTIAVFVGRFRSRPLTPPFRVSRVRLTRPPPAHPTRHEALLDAPVAFGCAVAAIDLPADVWRARLETADASLQALLRDLAERIGLGAGPSDLETAVRARLRALLPGGRAEAAYVARALGTSERTLHRRLRATGRAFGDVLEAFREAEAERLLAARVPLGEIALRLGYSDQTAWNRAFRRWKGMAPGAWLARGPRADAPPPGRGGRRRGPQPPRRR